MKEKVKIGCVGLGRRSTALIEQCFSKMADVEIAMICEKNEEYIEKIKTYLKENGNPEPIATREFDDLLENPELDAIVIMTGWQGRAELACKSMRAGKYTAIEVGGAFDLSECFKLVDTYEETGVPLMMLENCCYGREEMLALNVAEQGGFGEIVHCAGGYHHYLPDVELFVGLDGDYPHYRIKSYIERNCEQYPTHELGPISKVLKLNRGNKMLTLSSFSSKAAGLKARAKSLLGEDSPYAKIDYRQGDIVTTIITCLGGETIHLCLDTTTPRPYYSRNFTVRGSLGMYSEERKTLFFEGMEEEIENNIGEMYEKYDHPLWREYLAEGEKGGHNGIDWLVCRAFIESVKNETEPPIDVYDAALWMAATPLSEMSIARGGAPVDVPDFTRGKWISREPAVEGKYCLDKVCEVK
ncbi:MAG: Gfo/Idh/MocA family oxidoreductase [Oscillospiraceae bacterium]|nr:Gfo/Idh/MocA family oxidoreductase [Oscillospiraceae bacterium]